ncbi:hypothetical protein M2S00_03885 [Apilactobacillus sp. TMW 2.2459]|uniref:hypothetical protein n=1 Tax=Apilactobacillus xinyiensis TaxID=2841032 RepID=UPI00200C731E|nr:hypothetical protein [Apilactobacillus xinyiensis]MCL0312240.1 hypothetical protein [Apilactobacillus xinyiensis]
MKLRKIVYLAAFTALCILTFNTKVSASAVPEFDSSYWTTQWRYVQLTAPWKIKLSERYQDPVSKGWSRHTTKTRILPAGSKIYVTKYLDHMTVSLTRPNSIKSNGLGQKSWRYKVKNNLSLRLLGTKVKTTSNYKQAKVRNFSNQTWNYASLSEFDGQYNTFLFKNEKDLNAYLKYRGKYNAELEANDADFSDASKEEINAFHNSENQMKLYESKAFNWNNLSQRYLVQNYKNNTLKVLYQNRVYYTTATNLKPYNTSVDTNTINSTLMPTDYQNIVVRLGDKINLYKGMTWVQDMGPHKSTNWKYNGYKWIKQ